jgi:hypothetical protein
VPDPRIIAEFEVQSLFGMFDYNFTLGVDREGRTSHQTLLYGDNGTGKITLLRLMYHSLSKHRGDGSRGFLCRTPFKLLRLALIDGHSLTFEKDELQGPMRVSVSKDGVLSHTYNFTPNERNAVLLEKNPDALPFINFLASLNIDQLYLSDDRKIMTSYKSLHRVQDAHRWDIQEDGTVREVAPDQTDTLSTVDLSSLAQNVRQRLIDQILETTTSGSNGASSSPAHRLAHVFNSPPSREQAIRI